MGNKLKKTFEIFAEPAYKEAWKEVAKTSPEIRKIAVSQTNRVMLKNLLKVTGVTAAGTGAVKLFNH